ncbi:hypothetical protein WUBG_03147, partial [Wuchereria bancrofti]
MFTIPLALFPDFDLDNLGCNVVITPPILDILTETDLTGSVSHSRMSGRIFLATDFDTAMEDAFIWNKYPISCTSTQ